MHDPLTFGSDLFCGLLSDKKLSKIMITWLCRFTFHDPSSKKLWSHEYDHSQLYDYVDLIWEKSWSWILESYFKGSINNYFNAKAFNLTHSSSGHLLWLFFVPFLLITVFSQPISGQAESKNAHWKFRIVFFKKICRREQLEIYSVVFVIFD